MSTGLILSGGGARASYQVGVLKAVAEILHSPAKNPFQVICGTSAGAINATMLACESDRFSEGVGLLHSVWAGLDSGDVHDIGATAVATSIFQLMRSMMNEGHAAGKPWSLLNNSPLRSLLGSVIRFDRLTDRITNGDLSALVITALGYTSGASLSFFQADQSAKGWHRHRRVGASVKMTLDHLMASTAIPGIYPSVHINREYFGDGAVRQSGPLSPALHLGASKLFVIGVSHNPGEPDSQRVVTAHSPSLAQMTAHYLNGSFIDAVEHDLENVSRVNGMIEFLSDAQRAELNLKKVEVMSITPSKRIDECAAQYIDCLPKSMRLLFKMLGATRAGGGASLASYLLFERPFLNDLMATGYRDAMARHMEIAAFMASD